MTIDHNVADLFTLAISGVNLLLLVRLAFIVGHWKGTVDTRLDHLEREE